MSMVSKDLLLCLKRRCKKLLAKAGNLMGKTMMKIKIAQVEKVLHPHLQTKQLRMSIIANKGLLLCLKKKYKKLLAKVVKLMGKTMTQVATVPDNLSALN